MTAHLRKGAPSCFGASGIGRPTNAGTESLWRRMGPVNRRASPGAADKTITHYAKQRLTLGTGPG